MKYRVCIENYFPTYFYTKREALAFQQANGGEIQRKIGGSWYGY